MPFAIGENVGPYRIVQQLGQGGMATVFRAYHASLDRYVAIKVLHPAFTQDPTFQARFQREAKVVARLEHPNIVPVYDYAEHEGKPYLVMKFIQGETLKARMARGPVGVQAGLRIVDAVGSALAYAHRQGVLHRDIKPSNVLLSAEGPIYLADFGLARIAAAGESTLSSDMLLGTPQYISPEQARGDRDLDARTDIYSLGVVLYEMVVGQVPFNADTPFSIIHDHIYSPLPLPTKVNPLVPESVEQVLLKALAKDRSDRYPSVDDLVSAFRGSVSRPTGGSAVPTPQATWPPVVPSVAAATEAAAERRDGALAGAQVPRKRRMSRRTWILLGGVVAFVCACLTFLAIASRSQDGQTPGPTAPAEVTQPARPPVEEGAVETARRAVASEPENPVLRAELGTALLQNGQPRLAYAEFVKSGNLYLSRGQHAEAAKAYLSALSIPGEGGTKADPAVIERAEQALFLAAPDPAALDIIQEVRALAPDWPSLPLLEARAQIYAGQPEVATVLAAQALQQHPDDTMARAVQIELLIQSSATDEALVMVKETLRQEEMPLWLSEHLRNLLASIEAP